MLKLAALLSEGTGSVMDPLVTIDLLTAAIAIDSGIGACKGDRTRGSSGSGSDDVVDTVLSLARSYVSTLRKGRVWEVITRSCNTEKVLVGHMWDCFACPTALPG